MKIRLHIRNKVEMFCDEDTKAVNSPHKSNIDNL